MSQRDVRSRIDERLRTLRARIAKEAIDSHDNAKRSCFKALKTCQKNSAVRRACEIAVIDSSNPSALAALLIDLASARFAKETRGRSKDDWDSISLTLLLNWYFRLRKKYPGFSDKKIFGRLVKEVKYFRDKTPVTLRRRFVDVLR